MGLCPQRERERERERERDALHYDLTDYCYSSHHHGSDGRLWRDCDLWSLATEREMQYSIGLTDDQRAEGEPSPAGRQGLCGLCVPPSPPLPPAGRGLLGHDVPAAGEGGRREPACRLPQRRRRTTRNVPNAGPRAHGSLPRADPAWRGLFEAGTAAAPLRGS